MGIAASLGQTALHTFLHPLHLIHRLDDLAQDIESMNLEKRVWEVIETTAKRSNATTEFSVKLRRISCEYCFTANPVGTGTCVSCGAPLGNQQPTTCRSCGFVIHGEKSCPNCGNPISEKNSF
jgi:RNase P subunit RPR2